MSAPPARSINSGGNARRARRPRGPRRGCRRRRGPRPAEQPASSQGGREDRRVGLASSGARRGDDAVERAAEPAARQHLGQRDVPVRHADEPEAEPAKLGQRRRRVVERPGSGSRPSSSRPRPRGPARSRARRRSGRAAPPASRRRAPRGCAPCSRPSRRAPRSTRRSSGSTPSASARCTQGGSSSTRVPSASSSTARVGGKAGHASILTEEPAQRAMGLEWSRLLESHGL